MFKQQVHKFGLVGAVMLLSIISISACTWVKPTPDSDMVRVAPLDRVTDCKKLGSVKTHTKDKISVVNRKAEKVGTELETIARIDAAEMGADTIVATTKVVDGQQSFDVYKCLK